MNHLSLNEAEKDLGPIGQAVMRLGVLTYGLTEDRVWVA